MGFNVISNGYNFLAGNILKEIFIEVISPIVRYYRTYCNVYRGSSEDNITDKRSSDMAIQQIKPQ